MGGGMTGRVRDLERERNCENVSCPEIGLQKKYTKIRMSQTF